MARLAPRPLHRTDTPSVRTRVRRQAEDVRGADGEAAIAVAAAWPGDAMTFTGWLIVCSRVFTTSKGVMSNADATAPNVAEMARTRRSE